MDDLARNDPEPLRAFSDATAGNDPKTIAAYRLTARHGHQPGDHAVR